MNYIKNNKVFLFLVAILSSIILYLAFLLGAFDTFLPQKNASPYEEETGYTQTSLLTFNGQFLDDKESVYLNWHLVQANKKVESIGIYQNDTLVKEVTGNNSVNLSLKEYKFMTGNNAFQIKATLEDGSILEKSTYVYIDEAIQFNVKEMIGERKITYEVTYLYDTRRALNAPTVSISGVDESFIIQYIASEQLEKTDEYIRMKVLYELDFTNAKEAYHTIPIKWRFDAYNLEYDTTTTLQVEGQNE